MPVLTPCIPYIVLIKSKVSIYCIHSFLNEKIIAVFEPENILRNLPLILNLFLVNKNEIPPYPFIKQSYIFFYSVDNILNNFCLLQICLFFSLFTQI